MVSLSKFLQIDIFSIITIRRYCFTFTVEQLQVLVYNKQKTANNRIIVSGDDCVTFVDCIPLESIHLYFFFPHALKVGRALKKRNF